MFLFLMDCVFTKIKFIMTKTVLLANAEAYLEVLVLFMDGDLSNNMVAILDNLNSAVVKKPVESLTIILYFNRE